MVAAFFFSECTIQCNPDEFSCISSDIPYVSLLMRTMFDNGFAFEADQKIVAVIHHYYLLRVFDVWHSIVIENVQYLLH